MNTNEIQIRLTADIKALQSALTKAQKSLQDFEAKNAAETEKSNKGKQRQLGLIEKLNKEAQKLKTSITQATSKEDIAKFNAELEQTKKKLSELNALGKSSSTPVGLINNLNLQLKTLKKSIASATDEKDVARLNAELQRTEQELKRINALGKSFSTPAVKSFDNLKRSAGAASGAAISFGRIIQDAPFGIIGVANNIQNFGEQFAALGGKTATAGQKLSQFFTALIQPANLAILAVSALTAAWQAYSLGLFDAEKATDQVKESINEYRESLTESQASQLEGIKNSNDEIIKLNALKDIIEDETLERSKRLKAIEQVNQISPNLFKNLSTEAILAGKVGDAYEKVTRLLIAKATAESDIQKVVSLNDEERILKTNEKNIEVLNKISEIEEKVNRFRKEGQEEVAIAIENSIRVLKNQNPEVARLLEIETQREILTKSISDNLKIALDETKETNKEADKLNRVIDEQVLIIERFGTASEDAKKKLEGLAGVNLDLLAKEQKSLFEQITRLKSEGPLNLIDSIALLFAEKRLAEIDKIIGSIASKRTETEISIDENKLEGLELPTKTDPGIIEGLEKQIATFEKLKQVTSDPTMLALYTLKIDLLKNKLAEFNGEEVKSNLQLIADAFGSMGNQIANALGISNRSLRGFVTTLVSATPKIVAAILAKSEATRRAAAQENIANAKLAAGNSVVVATEGAKGLGPVGLALLPVFIAGALALVSSAFGKAGSAGGSPSAGQGSTFTNRREFGGPVSKGRAYIVGERRPELFVPNTNGIIVPQLPSMDYSGASMAAGAMAVDVNIRGVSYGDDILFTVQQAQIRRGIR